jgi:CheY-like chemotaxis protein
MSAKRALIVDDSKSARVILSRMLEKYDIEVDMAESAEQAIDYLGQHRPDAIFMDHLMPGMDGLQAVQAIKGNPLTATIPIMMYTSQEGELYVGQARALGAMGVLPKQVRPVDVSKVLYELHLLPDRRDFSDAALHPVELAELNRENTGVAAAPAVAAPDLGRRFDAAIKDQGADLRRFVVASLDSFATRIVSDVRDLLPAPVQPAVFAPVARASRGNSRWAWAGALALTALSAFFAWGWAASNAERDAVRRELAALTASSAEIKRSRDELSDTVRDLSAAVTAQYQSGLASLAGPMPSVGASAVRTVQRIEAVPYGEAPMDRNRLDALRDLLMKLEAQGFRGTVRVTSYAGAFCLSGNGVEGFTPAGTTLPVTKCEMIGNPFDDGLSVAQRQSLAFANLVTGVRQRTAGAIAVVVENAGATRNVAEYPARSEAVAAAEWNKAAATNNRVEFAVEPSAG